MKQNLDTLYITFIVDWDYLVPYLISGWLFYGRKRSGLFSRIYCTHGLCYDLNILDISYHNGKTLLVEISQQNRQINICYCYFDLREQL